MNAIHFRKELKHFQAQHPLFSQVHPFWGRCFRGHLRREDLRPWTLDVFPFVRDFPRFYLHVAIKCESVPMLTPICETIFEETGSGRETDAHSNLYKRFMDTLDLKETDVALERMSPSGRAVWEHAWKVTRDQSFLEGLALVGIAVERPLPRLFPMVAEALKRHLAMTAAEVEFFSIHSVADVKHSQTALKLISELADTAEKQEQVRVTLQTFWDLQKSHLDELNRAFVPAAPISPAARVSSNTPVLHG
jgi:pyrroloquinoline quinone (PQQ) biosynthesis protein C